MGVRVDKEDPATREQVTTTTAYLTFVQLDRNGIPQKVTALDPRTANEKRRHANAKQRVQSRKELRSRLKKVDR